MDNISNFTVGPRGTAFDNPEIRTNWPEGVGTTTIQVDANGPSGGSAFTSIIVLEGISAGLGIAVSLTTPMADGNLVLG